MPTFKPPFVVKNAAGEVVAGDETIDDALMAAANDASGRIEDADGLIVYTAPA